MTAEPTPSPVPGQPRHAAPQRTLALPLVVLALLLASLGVVCISVLSAARAYVGGESQWSRSQKSAAHHLQRYAETGDPNLWAAYLSAIEVPLGDRRAREELDRPEPDLAVVRDGFIAGLNHPDDIPGMIRLYRWFRDVPFMATAIATWAEGDRLIAELQTTAEALHRAVQSGAPASTRRLLSERVHAIDGALTPVEARFSATLGEASRLTQQLLVAAVVLGTAGLAGLTLVVMQRAAEREMRQSKALRDSEARFQRAMVGSSDGFWEWDMSVGLAYYSPRFETLLGYTPGTLSPRAETAKSLIHPDDAEATRRALSAHMRGGAPYDVTLRMRHADGSWRWMRSRAQLQHDGGPMPAPGERFEGMRLAGSVVDVTERRASEQALRANETLFRSLWETTNDAVLIVGTDHVIRFANPAAHQLFGHAGGQLLGQPLAVVQPQRMHAAHVAGVARYMANGSRRLDWRGSEIVGRHAQGHEFPLEIRFSHFELGSELHFVAFLRDISDRKRAERELLEARDRLEQRVQERTRELSQANERLLELDRLKSQFLATISHELRTPLNSILGFTTVLRQEMAGPLTEEQARQLGFVQASGQHLLSLINDLLDLSRIESGRMEVAREAYDFVDIAHEALQQLRPLAEGKGLALHLDLPSALPGVGDRRKLYQVLLNLAGNAVKFTQKGEVRIRARAHEGRLMVEVVDTGIGIDAQHVEALFEAFRQVDGSLVRNHEGTGLGLYLCRKLLDLMDGQISVRSSPGVGSCFCFSLPLQPGPAARVDAAPAVELST
jgi:PAS domain S-box-containing protein